MDNLEDRVRAVLERSSADYRMHRLDGRLLLLLRDGDKVDGLVSALRGEGLYVAYGEPVPDYYEWRQQIRREDIYIPEDLNEIADSLWKLREDIDEWKLLLSIPDEVVDLLLLGDRREIYFQLKKWGWDRRLEVVYFIEWFETYYGLLNFWREAIENIGANPFGRYYLLKVEDAPPEVA